jgi:transposase
MSMVETEDIGELKALISQLVAENTALRAQNAELLRRLNLTPANSHKPPSSQGYSKKPALPKPVQGKVGGQPGHPGKTLEMIAKPDQLISHAPAHCPDCGQVFSQPGQVIARRQVIDLPQPRLEVTEHQLLQQRCWCGCVAVGEFPAFVTAPVQYGPRLSALSSLLNVEYRVPFLKLAQLVADLTGGSYNPASACGANERLYEQLEPVETHIQTQLMQAPLTHHDETGVRVEGKLHWLHVACTGLLTYLFVHAKRGKLALQSAQSVFTSCLGWTVHDCWASYFAAGKGRHSLCGAHLLRELTALIEGGSVWAKLMHGLLMDLYQASRAGPVTNAGDWESRYAGICMAGYAQEKPPQLNPRGRPKQSKGRNLLDRLVAHQEAVLAFGFEIGVPFSNNQAERDLRAVKVKHRVSNGFRKSSGAAHYARIAGFVSTMRKNKLNVLEQLTNVRRGSFKWAT